MNLETYMPEPNSGCWLWTAGVSNSGYGVVRRRGRSASAHRVAYELAYGPVPAGLYVCHKCDVKTCINPDHLFAGTPKENTRDMITKGRRISPSTINRARGEAWAKAHASSLARGEGHHSAKLTWGAVGKIRSSQEAGVTLSRRYGISANTISRIRRGMIWKTAGG